MQRRDAHRWGGAGTASAGARVLCLTHWALVVTHTFTTGSVRMLSSTTSEGAEIASTSAVARIKEERRRGNGATRSGSGGGQALGGTVYEGPANAGSIAEQGLGGIEALTAATTTADTLVRWASEVARAGAATQVLIKDQRGRASGVPAGNDGTASAGTVVSIDDHLGGISARAAFAGTSGGWPLAGWANQLLVVTLTGATGAVVVHGGT